MRERLSNILKAVAPRLQQIEVDGIAAEDLALLEVSVALVRSVYQHCQSILALADARSWGGMASVERAAWEAWNELEFVIRSEEPRRLAAKVQANAVIDVIGLLEATDDAPEGMLDRNRAFLERLEKTHGDACDEVRAQRKKGKWHWSGGSRTKIAGPDEASKTVYKLLSWESHPDVASIRDIEVEFDNGVARVKLGNEGDGVAVIERSCRSGAELLLRSWNLLAQLWSLDEIEGLPGWDEAV